MRRTLLSIVPLALSLATSATAQTRTWSDTEFSTWTCTPLFSSNGSTVSCSQEVAGGNPGATYRIQHDVMTQGAVAGGHFAGDPLAVFDPLSEGPFGRIEAAFDANVTQGAVFGGAMGYIVILEQGGTIYYGHCNSDLVFIHEDWVRVSAELASDEFDVELGGSPTFPDLASGAPFSVGIYSSNGTCCGGGVAVAFVDNFEVTAVAGGGNIGTPYCLNGPVNSSNRSGEIFADGSELAAGRPLRLRARCLPDGVFGYFIASTTQGMVPNAGGSTGTLCLGGSVGRFNSLVQSSGHVGWFSIDVDTLAIPQANGAVAVQAGQTWNFQCWHRDAGSTSNFTSAIAITFQ